MDNSQNSSSSCLAAVGQMQQAGYFENQDCSCEFTTSGRKMKSTIQGNFHILEYFHYMALNRNPLTHLHVRYWVGLDLIRGWTWQSNWDKSWKLETTMIWRARKRIRIENVPFSWYSVRPGEIMVGIKRMQRARILLNSGKLSGSDTSQWLNTVMGTWHPTHQNMREVYWHSPNPPTTQSLSLLMSRY